VVSFEGKDKMSSQWFDCVAMLKYEHTTYFYNRGNQDIFIGLYNSGFGVYGLKLIPNSLGTFSFYKGDYILQIPTTRTPADARTWFGCKS
jgi:hypothetical protein